MSLMIRTAWAEYFRSELSSSMMMLAVCMNDIILYVNSVMLNISMIQLEKDPKKRNEQLTTRT